MKNIQVSAIVPAYNEEKGIRQVLEVLTKSKIIEEVVCVDDGSTDNTGRVIKSLPVKYLKVSKKNGKAFAICKGIRHAKGNVVLFVDADLKNLSNDHLSDLISPLNSGKYNGVIGYPTANLTHQWFIPLSGERAYFKKDLLPHLDKIKDKGYGLELYLNFIYKEKKIKLVALDKLENSLKHEKQSIETMTTLLFVECHDLIKEIIKQKNPFGYFVASYLETFYFHKSASSLKKRKEGFHLRRFIEKMYQNFS